MRYLIAHEDECYLITGKVPEHLKMQHHAGMHWACTCGGVKVSVPLCQPSATDVVELDFPSVSARSRRRDGVANRY